MKNISSGYLIFFLFTFELQCKSNISNDRIECFVLDDNYRVEIDLKNHQFERDSSMAYVGDESLIYLRSNELHTGVEIIIGRKNPSPIYFNVFNYNSKVRSQVEIDPQRKFISNGAYSINNIKINYVYYIFDHELELVESQFRIYDDLVINTRMIRNLKYFGEEKITRINRDVLENIKIINVK